MAKTQIKQLLKEGLWLYDRLDFTKNTTCDACFRPLTVGIAYFLRDPLDKEIQCGPRCARHLTKMTPKGVVVFTKASMRPEPDHLVLPAKLKVIAPKKRPREGDPDFIIGDPEIEYLRLRFERMTQFPKVLMGTEKLQEIWNRYKKIGYLVDEDKQEVAKLIKKVEGKKNRYTPENLQLCYAAAHVISIAIENTAEDRRGYLLKCLSSLRRHLCLDPEVVIGVSRWLVNIPWLPQVDFGPWMELG